MTSAGPGEMLGRYRLEAVVGTGAFAAVHRASDERLGDEVAVKVLADNHALDPEIRERFITEGRVLRRIDSPHVVRVHDIGETDRHQPYLVLELADRGTLAQRAADLRNRGWRPGPADVRVVARSLAAAVEALHRADLVHRDLSPGNVLLRSTVAPQDGEGARVVADDERLVLADLGLCKDLARHSGFTRASGTEGFRPPEQRAESGRVDARADLWALSALMVWLVAGRPPGEEPVEPAVVAAGLPRELGRALGVSLADDPQDRHADVTDWLDQVERALPTGPTGAMAAAAMGGVPDEAGLGPTDRPSPGPRRRGLVAGVTLAAGTLLGAAGTAVLVSDGDGGDDVDVTRREDGQMEVVQERGEARLALVGPDEVEVGTDAPYTVEADNLDRWVWLMPDGTTYQDEPRVRVRTESAGVARVILVGHSEDGERLEVVHDLRVHD